MKLVIAVGMFFGCCLTNAVAHPKPTATAAVQQSADTQAIPTSRALLFAKQRRAKDGVATRSAFPKSHALSTSSCGEGDLSPEACPGENEGWIGYDFGWYWGGDIFDVSAAIEKLPTVETTGRRSLIVCVNGNDCDWYDGFEMFGPEPYVGLGGNVFVEYLKELLGVESPKPVVSACAVTTYLEPGSEGHPRETTSHSDPLARQIAGADILINSVLINTIGMNSQEVVVTYSDGGTETFKYIAGNPRSSYIIQPSDLKRGTGQSKCS